MRSVLILVAASTAKSGCVKPGQKPYLAPEQRVRSW
ncbi:MAG: hypothetical protein JWO25_1865 [Alphaproteobacteria bacterium]|nr:hypothetical protein [Alphaproteobacteria bacterium]